MKKFIALLISLLVSAVAMAQPSPVKWSATATEVDGQTCEVQLTVDIDEGWHIYDFGPYAEDLFIHTTPIFFFIFDSCLSFQFKAS